MFVSVLRTARSFPGELHGVTVKAVTIVAAVDWPSQRNMWRRLLQPSTKIDVLMTYRMEYFR